MTPSPRVMRLIELFRMVYTSGMGGPQPIYTYTELMDMPAWQSQGLKAIEREVSAYHEETTPKSPKNKDKT